MQQLKVLIADDHSVVRDGIKQILTGLEDIEIAGEAADGLEAIELVKSLKPDVVLLDIAMPNLNGLECISLILAAEPETRVVVLSMHSNENYVHQVLNAGAYGYVLKASPSSDIIEAIRSAWKKEYFLSSKLRANVIDAYLQSKKNKPVARGYDLLSEREQQVFRLVVEGKSTKEIAGILNISPKTIEKHQSSISSKLGVHGRLELLKYAVRLGIVDPELWEF